MELVKLLKANPALIVKELEKQDWTILHTIESELLFKEWVFTDKISKLTSLHKDEVNYRLGNLEKKGLVTRKEQGYMLLNSGLDSISLKAFASKQQISAIGKVIGVGKEAEVYEAISENGTEYAIKFYRIGRISFRNIKRTRNYSSSASTHRWIQMSIQAAKNEFQAMSTLLDHKVSVPQVISRERHAILMTRFEGVKLADVSQLEDPKSLLENILTNIKIAYTQCGLINSDLSEFNILFNGKDISLIDWPQVVDRHHLNSDSLLDRDILNMLRFFNKRFGLDYNQEAAYFFVRGWRSTLF